MEKEGERGELARCEKEAERVRKKTWWMWMFGLGWVGLCCDIM